MSKKTKAAVVTETSFSLPDGLDTTMQVIPTDLLQFMADTLGSLPASSTRNVLNALEKYQSEKKVQPIADYLKSLSND